MCPGCVATRASHESALRCKVGVGVERDVGHRVAVADQEGRVGQVRVHCGQCGMSRAQLALRSDSSGAIPASAPKRATAMCGSWLYCSKKEGFRYPLELPAFEGAWSG
jgi:hypothetical protein